MFESVNKAPIINILNINFIIDAKGTNFTLYFQYCIVV